MNSGKRVLGVFLAIGALLPAACAQYLDRKDTVAFSAGDAVQTDVVAHVIDPWPARARKTRLVFDGERMQKSIERYRTNRVTDPGCAREGSQGGAAPTAGPAPATSGGTPCAEPASRGSAAPGAASGETTR